MESILNVAYGETQDQYLMRIGTLKEDGKVPYTWNDIAAFMNEKFCPDSPKDPSTYRKRFHRMQDQLDCDNVIDFATEKARFEAAEEEDEQPDENKTCEIVDFFREAEKERIRLRDERVAYNRLMRQSARADAIINLFREEVSRYPAKPPMPRSTSLETGNIIYALLGDVHYGSEFSSCAGAYNTDLAKTRIRRYMDTIISLQRNTEAEFCYVTLLGDMISGNIHQTIRAENRENVVQQVIGISELVAEFLYTLSQYFQDVYVNSVSGNHSRLDLNDEDALRGEKMDALIPWYCAAKLENQSNVHFCKNQIDDTVASFSIYGYTYAAVHGDYDKDLEKTALRIERITGKPVDYMLAGHMHTAGMHIGTTSYIRNGSLSGSGDEYTMKKRLFGPPCQVMMLVGRNGVESVYPVMLDWRDAK